jgi:catechol 2,3-dioxygenase-like lactoylglutathione lyase family enzyme
MLGPAGSDDTVSLVAATGDAAVGIETGIRFEAADAAAAHDALAAAGVDVGELLLWPGVPPMFAAHDTDGNRFEIVQP